MVRGKQSEEQKEKEYLRLRWEYLKRSNNYKEFCEFIREKIKGGTNPRYITYPKKFRKKGGSKYDLDPHIFENYFIDFGDVHIKTFDYWWTVRKLVKEKETKAHDSKGVEVYDFEQDIDSCIEFFKKTNGREPTLKEFKDEFVPYNNYYRNKLYLKIDLLTPKKAEDLVKQIGKIVKEQRRDSFIRGLRSRINLEPFSSAKVKEKYLRCEELWRYLEIYDYKKQGLSMRDIIGKMGKNSRDTDVRSMFHQDLKRAKRLIKNVESCIFPGDYQPKD